jgi:hypothetical protein
MTTKIEAAKNLAAVKALEAYAQSLREQLSDQEVVDLDHTEHVHTAILLQGETAVALCAHWSFSADPKVVAKCLAMKKGQGVA